MAPVLRKKKIKVVHIITQLDLGGAQQNTLYTVSHLDKDVFEPVLITGPEGNGGFAPPDCRTIVVDSLVRPIRLPGDLLALIKLWWILVRERPAIVHTHSSKAGVLGRIAALFALVPVRIHTYHGFGFHWHQRRREWIKFVVLEKLCSMTSTVSIFVSKANMDLAAHLGFWTWKGKRLIRSGISLENFPANISKVEARKRLRLPEHEPVVVSVGNLKKQKNPEEFCDIAERCIGQLPEVSFCFVGNGAENNPYAVKVKKRVDKFNAFTRGKGKIRLLGWREDVPEILAAADVFMLTSLWEGLPRSLVEAMKSGLPSVCYATDGVTDIVTDAQNGFLVKQHDVEKATQKLLLLLRDSGLRQSLGGQAKQTIKNEFDIDSMVVQQEQLYLELCGGFR